MFGGDLVKVVLDPLDMLLPEEHRPDVPTVPDYMMFDDRTSVGSSTTPPASPPTGF